MALHGVRRLGHYFGLITCIESEQTLTQPAPTAEPIRRGYGRLGEDKNVYPGTQQVTRMKCALMQRSIRPIKSPNWPFFFVTAN